MKTNAENAFNQYVMWLGWYPGDYDGATQSASDFIDSEADLDELEKLIKKAAG